MNIDKLCVNTMRSLGIAMVDEANSGHPGIVLGAAPMMYTLFTRHLNLSVEDQWWISGDKFVMAAGHGSALYYATLHLCGYDIKIDDLKKFRQYNSKTPGHPEYRHTPGVQATSGPLGQGIAMACGMAIAEEFLRFKYNVVNNYTYVLCGDGDLQEGVTQEAVSLAGHLGLGRLVVLYDSNDIQLDSPVSDTNSEDVKKKYEAMGWHYILVEDGNNIDEIDTAIVEAKHVDTKPSIIEVKTEIGYGSSKANSPSVHGSPLGVEESANTMQKLDYALDRFEVSKEVYEHFADTFKARGSKKYQAWKEMLEMYQSDSPKLYDDIIKFMSRSVVTDYEELFKKFDDPNSMEATRSLGGKVLDEIANYNPFLLAGSADLSGSTKVKGADGDFTKDHRIGRNIKFGVREHAMAAIANGISLHSSLDVVVGGFFVFSDYAKPAIRMAALMNIPTIFTFTHDSVAVGEDGPTHQPVEQLTMLRSTPNIDVFRPADLSEVIASYEMALNKQNPSAIVLTRQNVKALANSSVSKAKKGAYLVRTFNDPQGIIIASGSEVSLALAVSEKLEESNVYYNVVSMLSMDIFNSQSKEYIESVLPKKIRRRVAIEMGSSYSWYQYVGLDGLIFGIDRFGLSAKPEKVIEHFGFDVDKITYEIIKLKNVNK